MLFIGLQHKYREYLLVKSSYEELWYFYFVLGAETFEVLGKKRQRPLWFQPDINSQDSVNDLGISF